MARKMIINADDFGLCEGVNKAVADAHSKGVLTSATIMANTPGADKAAAIAGQMPSLGVGIHLNLTEGRPISSDPQVEPLVDEDGKFKYSVYKLAAKSALSKRLLGAIEIELTAQIETIINKGIKPTHLDSHKHFHCFWPIYKIVCSLADGFGIGAIRWPWEPATVCDGDWPKVGFGDRMRALLLRQMTLNCQKIDSRFIKNDIFFGAAHTGKIDDKFWAEIGKTQFAGVAEVMTHPGYAEGLGNTRLVGQRETELKWLCEPRTKEILNDAGIELVHYGNIDGK
jgi:predicted glycoside hydrolase/deacetylase ChbG (UPF0249 family)